MSDSDVAHEPWVGPSYPSTKILIWGFSHHRDLHEVDRTGFTRRVIEELAIPGKHWFFNRICSYFNAVDPEDFWNQVAFANTLPRAVLTEDRYSAGSTNDRAAVESRVRDILGILSPRITILFSRKGWSIWPAFDGIGFEGTLSDPPMAYFGSYLTDRNKEVAAYCLPHPQFQSVAQMKRLVTAVLHRHGGFITT